MPLSALGVANQITFSGFVIQDSAGATEPTFYLDDIVLVAGNNTPGSNAPVAIALNALVIQSSPLTALTLAVIETTSRSFPHRDGEVHCLASFRPDRYQSRRCR